MRDEEKTKVQLINEFPPTPIAITGLKGNLIYVNPSFLKLWGYDDEKEILGKPVTEFWQMKERP